MTASLKGAAPPSRRTILHPASYPGNDQAGVAGVIWILALMCVAAAIISVTLSIPGEEPGARRSLPAHELPPANSPHKLFAARRQLSPAT